MAKNGVTNKSAPKGKVWVCMKCGKISKDLLGKRAISDIWQACCKLHCTLFKIDQLVVRDLEVVEILDD